MHVIYVEQLSLLTSIIKLGSILFQQNSQFPRIHKQQLHPNKNSLECTEINLLWSLSDSMTVIAEFGQLTGQTECLIDRQTDHVVYTGRFRGVL